MSNEFKVKNGLIINNTVPVSGIVSGSLSNDNMSLVTENIIYGMSGTVDNIKRYSRYNATPVTISSAGTTQITLPWKTGEAEYIFAVNPGSYIHNIQLLSAGVLTGAKINLLMSLPNSTGVVINILNQAGTTLLSFSSNDVGFAYPVNQFIFDGSDWAWWFGGKTLESQIQLADTQDQLRSIVGVESEYIPLSGSTAINGSLVPSVSSANLGSLARQWKDVYSRTVDAAGKITFRESEWTGGNVTSVPITGNLNSYIAAAVPGDTLLLGSGTYAITADLVVNKALTIKGQGSSSIIASATNSVKLINITASNVKLTDIALVHTGGIFAVGIYAGENLSGITITNISLNMTGTGNKYGIDVLSSSLNLFNCVITIVSDEIAYGIRLKNNSSATSNNTKALLNVIVRVTGTIGSEAYFINNINTAKIITVQMWNCTCTAIAAINGSTNSGLHLLSSITNTITVTAVNCLFGGADYDVLVETPNIVNLFGSSLQHGVDKTTNGGVINYLGYSASEQIFTRGINAFQPVQGIGYVTNDASGYVVSGHGTQFTNTFKVFDTITIGSETVGISAILSDAVLLTLQSLTSAHSGVVYTLLGGELLTVHGNGQIGVGTSQPMNLFHISGTNITPDADDNLPNFLMLDSVPQGDAGLTLALNGVKKFDTYMYRNENGRAMYRYGQESQMDLETIMENGKYGWLQPSNWTNYHTIYTTISGGILDDLDCGPNSDYNSLIPYNKLFKIRIVSAGNPDTFEYSTSINNGSTWSSWVGPLSCNTTEQELEDGVTTLFVSSSGHSTNDAWSFTAFSLSPQGTFTIHPVYYQEINTTTDYTLDTAESRLDLTMESNSIASTPYVIVPLGAGGTAHGAVMFGAHFKINGVYFYITTAAVGATMVYEYWKDGVGWTEITGAENLNDGTYGMTQTGLITWNKDAMTDWATYQLPGETGASYNLYWIRIRSSSVMSVAPEITIMAPHGDKRFSVYTSHFDVNPTFYIDAAGKMHLNHANGYGDIVEFSNNSDNNGIGMSVDHGAISISLYENGRDSNHSTSLVPGGMRFNTNGVDSQFINKYNQAFKFYKNANMSNDLILHLETDGSISTGVSGYEYLVSDNNDIPNKKYVDSLIGGMQLQGNWNAATNMPNITGTTQVGYAWAVSVSGNTDLGGLTNWQVGEMAVKNFAGWTKINAIPAIWGTILGSITNQSDLNSALANKVETSYLPTWKGNSYIASVGTVTGGVWHGTRITPTYLDTSVTTQGNTFNGINQLIKLNSSGQIPALSGNLITNLTWNNINKTGSSLANLVTRSAADLNAGNLSIDRMPLGGTWTLTSPLIIMNSSFEIAQSSSGPGTVSNLAGGTSVLGVGTQFLNTFKVGDTITIPATVGQTVTITFITDNEHLTTTAITNVNNNVAYSLDGGTVFTTLGNGETYLSHGVGVDEFSSDGTLADNSDLAVPTEHAVKTYFDTNQHVQDLVISGKLLRSDFNTYSGLVNVAQHNQDLAITGKVATSTYVAGQHTQDLVISGKLLRSDFNTYSGLVNVAQHNQDLATTGRVTTSTYTVGQHTQDLVISGKMSLSVYTTGQHSQDLAITGKVSTSTLNSWSGSVNIHTVGTLSGMQWATVSKSGAYNIKSTDVVILCDTTSTAFTVTLPTAVGVTGKVYTIKRIAAGTNRLTVATTSSQTIDGLTTALLDGQYNSITVISDGANWNII